MAEIIIMGELLVEIMRPQEDTPLYETDYFRGPFPSGAPGIFISTVARLNHSAAIISGVGDDDFGKNVLSRLKKDGVNVDNVIVSDKGNTGVAFVSYSSDGDRKYAFYMSNSPFTMSKAPANNQEEFRDTKFMHIMGCSLMSNANFANEIIKTMHMMKANGVKISFDPNVRLEMTSDISVLKEVFANCAVLMPGVSELKMLTGEQSIDDAIAKVFQSPALEILVLKNGSKGSQVYTRKGLEHTQPIYKVKQADATGAGDSYDAAFICGLAEGKTLAESAQMGAAAGALNAAAFGPMEGNISVDTVREMIAQNER